MNLENQGQAIQERMDKLVEILKPYARKVESPAEFSLDVNNLWRWLVEQICLRGGSPPMDSLVDRGEKERFLSQLSLEKMPLSYDHILQLLINFRATRFKPSASKTIMENYSRCFSGNEFKFIYLFKRDSPKKELTKERIEAERRIRKELKIERAFVWILRRGDRWLVSGWKNKPISDWLKDIGFAITLMPFDTNVKKVLKELGIKVNDENYENVEDIFINQICPRLGIFPSQVDKILYENSNKIIDSLRKPET